MKPNATANIFSQPFRPAQPQHSSAMEQQIALSNFNAGRFAETELFSRKLTASYPNDGFGWKMLGVSLFKLGRVQDALEPMKKAALMMSQDWEAFGNLGTAYQALGDVDHAQACLEHALQLNPKHIESLGNLAELHHGLGHRDQALSVYRRKAELVPQDGYTAHMVATLGGQQTTQAPAGYVTRVFDGYAPNFDAHLTGELQYKVPAQLAELLQALASPAAASLDVLDLGCGTGLSALPFAPMARSLVGIDLSAGMLQRARQRGVYQRLVESDVLTALKAEPDASFDLVLSADVFIYVGELDTVTAEVRRVLRPGGHYAFSVEDLPTAAGRAMQLEPTGRYSHASSYLQQLASQHSFRILKDEEVNLRLDGSTPVAGRLHIWG